MRHWCRKVVPLAGGLALALPAFAQTSGGNATNSGTGAGYERPSGTSSELEQNPNAQKPANNRGPGFGAGPANPPSQSNPPVGADPEQSKPTTNNWQAGVTGTTGPHSSSDAAGKGNPQEAPQQTPHTRANQIGNSSQSGAETKGVENSNTGVTQGW